MWIYIGGFGQDQCAMVDISRRIFPDGEEIWLIFAGIKHISGNMVDVSRYHFQM